ncbi:hypothetical protein Cyrtocomes_00126 [Candidatus Cyrtobacter comes]|uniref:Bacterial CdiA-CT RNAse A domain-containing protein n=1 Tax=Candidatus Cyrtobacter comes TaxID=675776 RepID=A0ABU5L6M3_9RICK|nr:RNase A-like domain-containing protein [Candidatus Cyrtobacter comes]MDZ5761768.1 hypothetical protein [Candidatus Cyrtobacter comes]
MFINFLTITSILAFGGVKLGDSNLFRAPLCKEMHLVYHTHQCHKSRLALRPLNKSTCCANAALSSVSKISRLYNITQHSICNCNKINKNISISYKQLLANYKAGDVASSYYNRKIAEEAIKAAFLVDGGKIQRWVADENSQEVLIMKYIANKDVGYGINPRTGSIIKMRGVALVLKKEKKCELKIEACYPIDASKIDKQDSAVM